MRRRLQAHLHQVGLAERRLRAAARRASPLCVMHDISRLSVWNDSETPARHSGRDRVRGHRRRGAGVHVAGRADLEVHAHRLDLVDQVRARRVAERVGQPHAVADAARAQPDRPRRTRSAASASPACSVSGRPASRAARSARGVLGRRVAGFGAGEVEADHARGPGSAAPARAARSVSAGGRWRIAQTISPLGSALRAKPGEQRLDRRLAGARRGPRTAAARCGTRPARSRRRSASSAASKATRASAVGRGHRRHRQRKALEVLGQAAGVGVGVEPGRQLRSVGRRRRQAALPAAARTAWPTRRPPSRCSCSSTLGSAQARSSVSPGVMRGRACGIVEQRPFQRQRPAARVAPESRAARVLLSCRPPRRRKDPAP